MKKILVIRSDNIGDLVCTTPLLAALRQRYPDARIDALVNSYNAAILDGNPSLDHVHVYRKAKHRATGEHRLVVWWQTLQLILKLRRVHFDLIVVATPGAAKLADWIGASQILAHAQNESARTCHEAEHAMSLLQPLGISEPPGPQTLIADPGQAAQIKLPKGDAPLIGLHISARKPLQRWPIERFAEFAHALHARHGARFLLFWSPGAEDHPQHPGDDHKAERLLEQCHDLPFSACPTQRLEELIAGLSHCDRIVCSDGGAMHVAAGLGKPIVCFFGNSDAERWHPWGVDYELLQPESHNVADVSVDDALAAFERLERRLVNRG